MKMNWKKLLCMTLCLIMLLSVCVACGKKNDDDGEPVVTTPPAETPGASTGENPHQVVKGTDAYFSIVEGSLCVTYLSYNSENNPVVERSFPLNEPEGYLLTAYEYNEAGLLVGVNAKFYSLDNYSEFEPYYSVKYTLDGKNYTSAAVYTGEDQEADEDLLSTVTYHDNGTIKQWTLAGKSGDNNSMGFSMDEKGRRTLIEEWGEKLSLTYEGDSRNAASATYGDGDWSVALALTYTDGKLAKATLEDADSGYFDIEITTTADGKYLAKSSWLQAESAEATESEKQVYEMTYTDKGMYASISYAYYENDVLEGKYVYALEYNAQGKMTKQTETEYDGTGAVAGTAVSEYTYDAAGNRTKETSKSYDENGTLQNTRTEEKEYNAAGKVTKRTEKRMLADGTVTDHEVYEFEYDAKGNRTKESSKSFDATGAVMRHEETRYEYDDKGVCHKTERYTYDSEGNVLNCYSNAWSAEYYANGETKTYTTMTVVYEGTQIVDKYKTVYEYNENGEQTKRTTYYYNNPDNRDEITHTDVQNYQNAQA